MAEYTVTKVSAETPREHFNEKFNTTTYYIKVMLEGHERPVTIGKKSPDALKVGDIVNGTIVPTEYDTDNFKAEFNKPGATFAPKDQAEIKAQFAIKAAIAHSAGQNVSLGKIEVAAMQIFHMIDRVKATGVSAPDEAKPVSGYEQAQAKANELRGQQPPSKDTKSYDSVAGFEGAEEINLDDIPF